MVRRRTLTRRVRAATKQDHCRLPRLAGDAVRSHFFFEAGFLAVAFLADAFLGGLA